MHKQMHYFDWKLMELFTLNQFRINPKSDLGI